MPPEGDARGHITQVTTPGRTKSLFLLPAAHSPPGLTDNHMPATRCPLPTMCLTPTMRPMPAAHHVPTAHHPPTQTGCPVWTAPWCPPLPFLHYSSVSECHVVPFLLCPNPSRSNAKGSKSDSLSNQLSRGIFKICLLPSPSLSPSPLVIFFVSQESTSIMTVMCESSAQGTNWQGKWG